MMSASEIRHISRTALTLWLLSAFFCLRVVGQIVVELWHVSFLPPSEEWFSGLLPYRELLICQFLSIGLMAKINLDFTRRSGWSYRPNRLAGKSLLVFGIVYLVVMVIRYVIRMSLYPHERWSGGSIPIFFHWGLAAYLLLLGIHHWRHFQNQSENNSSTRRVWFTRCAWFAGGSIVVTCLALWVAYLLFPSLLARQLGMRPAEFAVRIDRRIPLTTTDGIQLVADIYHPCRTGIKTPTILVRIPYSKTLVNSLFATIVGRMWAERGYTVVIQGTRGRYDSEGAYYPMRGERQDGVETLAWLATQPWYDGRVGMWGCSYYAYTEWVLADCSNPGPTALIIQEASTDFYQMFHPGGAFSLKSALYWAVMSHGPSDVTPIPHDLQKGFDGFPLIEADDRAAVDIGFFNDWVAHAQRDEYWVRIDGQNRAQQLTAPTLLMAGWYDPFLPSQLDDYSRIRQQAAPNVGSAVRLIIGPWVHAGTLDFPDGTMPRNFRLESLAPSVSWFDEHLLHSSTSGCAPVRIYVMGTHEWRDEREWPLARTQYTPYYLHSDGHANTSAGDGILATYPASGAESSDTYDYDPNDPVPTAGGAMLGPNSGIALQNAVESRWDVLVYTSEPVDRNLEVTGPIDLILYVSTSAPTTDFTGKLVDVLPDGSTYNISEGILRRQYQQPSANLGNPEEIALSLSPTSFVFLKGHRIRLEVSSSNYPRFDRNTNTGKPAPTDTTTAVARQSIHHSSQSLSRIILPVIPSPERDSDRKMD